MKFTPSIMTTMILPSRLVIEQREGALAVVASTMQAAEDHLMIASLGTKII